VGDRGKRAVEQFARVGGIGRQPAGLHDRLVRRSQHFLEALALIRLDLHQLRHFGHHRTSPIEPLEDLSGRFARARSAARGLPAADGTLYRDPYQPPGAACAAVR
jgi:hypothetical protein